MTAVAQFHAIALTTSTAPAELPSCAQIEPETAEFRELMAQLQEQLQ